MWPYLGAVIGAAVTHLIAAGDVPHGVTLVPAPTKPSSARARGGDHVTAMCAASGYGYVNAVYHGMRVHDSVGLDLTSRRANVAGNIVLRTVPPGPLLIVDDIVTTGSTIEATAAALMSRGGSVIGALVLAAV